MIVRLHSHYESAGETATLYLTGSLRPGEEDVLYRTLAALPSHIRVVRVDLNALERLSEDVVDTVRHVLARCRAHRGGTYHLAVSPISIPCEEVDAACGDAPAAVPLYARARARRTVDAVPPDAGQSPYFAPR